MQRKRPTRKQYIVAAGIVAVLAAGILWLLFSGGSDRAKRHPGKDDQEVPLSDKDGLPIINEDPAEALAYFRKWAKYPPYSRPLAGHELSEANPFLGNKLTNRVVVKPPGDCAQTPEGVKCLKEAVYSNVACEITPESSISVGKKDFRIFLSCSKFENAEKQPQRIAKLDIQQTKIEHLQYDQNMAKAGSLPPLHVGDDGMGGDSAKGDGIYTITVRPGPADWGEIYLTVDFVVDGLRHREVATWYATPHSVAHFEESGITHRFADGHLKLTIPVIVDKAGFYEFSANLKSAADPDGFIATSSRNIELTAGRNVIELVFWGKVIRDRGLDGPYVMTDLRGWRHNAGVSPGMVAAALEMGSKLPEPSEDKAEPIKEFMEPGPEHGGMVFAAKDFSDAEWDSELKRSRISFLKKMIQEE